jgi:hypothetical protein
MTNGCQKAAVHGAHVRSPGDRTIYIIGLCASCNHPSNRARFSVDQRSWWILARYKRGCGDLPDLDVGDVVRHRDKRERYELLELRGREDDKQRWYVEELFGAGRHKTITLYGRTVRRVG